MNFVITLSKYRLVDLQTTLTMLRVTLTMLCVNIGILHDDEIPRSDGSNVVDSQVCL